MMSQSLTPGQKIVLNKKQQNTNNKATNRLAPLTNNQSANTTYNDQQADAYPNQTSGQINTQNMHQTNNSVPQPLPPAQTNTGMRKFGGMQQPFSQPTDDPADDFEDDVDYTMQPQEFNSYTPGAFPQKSPQNFNYGARPANGNNAFPKPGAAPAQLQLNKLSEDERRAVLNKVFKQVLGRDATDKDYAYYRYSFLTESGLVTHLLSQPEHTNIIKNGQQFNKTKEEHDKAQIRVKYLENQINSLQYELNTLRSMLEEKNRHIEQLRAHLNQINYNRGGAMEPPSYNLSYGNTVSQPQAESVPQNNQPQPYIEPNVETKTIFPSFLDDIKGMFKRLISK